MGWLTGWNYRKSHVINAATGAGANYQVKITVHYSTGSDGDDDVYCSNHCKTDFADIRFTDNDGSTVLKCWMESKTDSDNVVFWVKVEDSLESANQTIYVYYGKTDATTISNGANTFPMFIDGTGNGLTKYASNPVLIRGADGEPDYATVRDCTIIKVGSVYYLAYVAYSKTDATNVSTICMAYSTDLINWTKMGIAISPASGWESKYVCDPTLYYNSVDSKYYLFYCGGTTASNGVPTLPSSIGVATNPDITDVDGWTKYGSNPVLLYNTQTGVDDYSVTSPTIIKSGSTYYMFYGNQPSSSLRGISYATSSDLLNWTKYASNPVIATSEDVENPDVWFDTEDNRYYMAVNQVINNAYTDANILYYSDSLTSWDITKRRYLFMESQKTGTWDKIIIGSMAVYVDENGRLQNILYDAKSTYVGSTADHYGRDIGLVTVDWNFNKLFDFSRGTGAVGYFSYDYSATTLRIHGSKTTTHNAATWAKVQLPTGDYESVVKMLGTWNTNYYNSGIIMANSVAGATDKKIYSELMHEATDTPHICVWQEYYVSSRVAYYPTTRLAEPSFPSDAYIKLLKLGNVYTTQLKFAYGDAWQGVPTHTVDFGGLAYIGICCNNDDNANTFDCDFYSFYSRKYCSPEPAHSTWGTEEQYEQENVTKDYSVDVVVKSSDIIKTYSIDEIIKKLDTAKDYSIDIAIKSSGVIKTYSIDEVIKTKDELSNYSLDILSALTVQKQYNIDELIKKLNVSKDYDLDVIFQISNLKNYSIDTLLKKLNIPSTLSVDVVFKKLGVNVSYLVDNVLMWNLIKQYSLDSVISALNISKSYSIDVFIAELITASTYKIDVLLLKLGTSSSFSIDVVLREEHAEVKQYKTGSPHFIICPECGELFSENDVTLLKLNWCRIIECKYCGHVLKIKDKDRNT